MYFLHRPLKVSISNMLLWYIIIETKCVIILISSSKWSYWLCTCQFLENLPNLWTDLIMFDLDRFSLCEWQHNSFKSGVCVKILTTNFSMNASTFTYVPICILKKNIQLIFIKVAVTFSEWWQSYRLSSSLLMSLG